MSKKALTTEQEKEVAALYTAGGETVYTLAAKFNVSTQPITRILAAAGLKSEQRRTELHLTPEVRAEIAAACRKGEKIDNIVKKHNIARRTVTQILQTHGVRLVGGRPPTR